MSKKFVSGAPKKARWTPAEKKARAVSATKKPHRGQGSRATGPSSAAGERRPFDRDSRRDGGYERRDDRGERRPFNRDDRGDRGFDRRDDRREGGYQRPEDRGERRPFNRDDRREGGYQRRDDRGERRPFNRDDRREGGYQRPEDRGERRPFNRDDHREGGYQRRDDRGERRPFNRDDHRQGGYQRRDDRGFQRRDDRGEGGYQRRDDRGERRPFNRDDRGDRGFQRRDDRGERRPFNRDDRGDRGFQRRDDRGERRPFNRDDRGEGGYQRRDDRGFDRRDGRYSDRRRSWTDRPDPERAAQEAEAERLDADTWTKASRTPVSDGPVEVAEDNGFAALGLPDLLVERLARDGITQPFPIQTATIPDALAGKDVLGRGQTGSGKTLAFGLPMIARLLQSGNSRTPRRPRALVLVPTRELAMQVSDALEPLVHVVGLRHKLVAGGLSYTNQINALNKGIDLLIATPGRLNDLLERGAVEMDRVEITVLDEADHMAEMGFLEEISTSLDLVPADGQKLLFSATLDNGIDTLVERYLTDPVTHSTNDATASVETMEHHVLLIDPVHKKVITAEVANRVGRTVVFVRTKLGADRVAAQLREQGVMAAALHGGLGQGARNRVLGAFRSGSLPVLVATDVAARGIHVDDVSVVLQVDPPADHKDYLHRSGRTARAGDKGTVVTLALPHQRRTMERQLRDAGVDTVPVKAAPGDAIIAATGASAPSGVPIPEDEFARLIEGPKPHRRGPAGSRGPRHGAARGGHRPLHGRGHGVRRGRDEGVVGRWSDEDRGNRRGARY